MTNYRVAVVPHGGRKAPRWIPLEEVSSILCKAGSSNLKIDASVEVLRFGSRRAAKLHDIVEIIRSNVREARSGRSGGGHNATLVQMWCDRTSEIWDSPFGRARLWFDHHPRARWLALTPIAPIVYAFVSQYA